MSRASVLAAGRRAAEAGFVDTCTIRRVIGTTTDPNSGVVTPTYSTLYTGQRCRVQQRAEATPAEAGEAHLEILPVEVQLPMAVVGLAVDDEIVVTASAHDADLVGRVLLVRSLAHKTHATARRVGCRERTG